MQDSIKQFVIHLIEKKGKLPKLEDPEGFNFIDSGYIDSIAIIKFIAEIEMKFDIEILESDLESDQFRTIGGLSKIISNKIRPLK